MRQTAIRLPETMIEALDREADSKGVTRAEHMRSILESRSETEELRRRVERLEREKRMILEQREENQELMRHVDAERTWREAGLVQRLSWWLTGMD